MTKNRDLYPEIRPNFYPDKEQLLFTGDKVRLEGLITSTRWNDYNVECYVEFPKVGDGWGVWLQQKRILRDNQPEYHI